MSMLPGGVVALAVLTVVVIAIVIQDVTRYTPQSRLETLTTSFAAVIVIVWFVAGIILDLHKRHTFSVSVFLSRRITSGIFAVLIVWFAFFRNDDK